MPQLRRSIAIALLVGVVIGSWVVITPEGGGPDEVSHLVRAGGVARGQSGRDDGADTFYEVTDTYLLPDVTCWYFQPTVSSACAQPRATSGATIEIPSRSGEYPIWSHLWAGVASRLPGADPIWWARLANAVLATALVGAALASVRRRPLAAAGVLVALTPMAWFSFSIVNPSSMAIAGGIALWTGLVLRRDLGWLTAVGWAALALPRRDGLVWACLALAIVVVVLGRSLPGWWRSLGRGPQIIVAISTAVAIVWAIRTGTRVSQASAIAPLAVLVAELARRWWIARSATRGQRATVVATAAGLGVVATVVTVLQRPGGWDGELAGRVVGQTGANLVEAIGVLGWLDTNLPWLAIVGWVAALGILVGAGLADRADWAVIAACVLGATIVTAWVFELYQGNTSGTYWQGRYSLPLLAGVPIALGAAELRADAERVVATTVVATALTIDNVALWAAARRFGVGVDGSLLPWDWHTYGAPIAPVVVVTIHLAATIALARVLLEVPSTGARTVDRASMALVAG